MVRTCREQSLAMRVPTVAAHELLKNTMYLAFSGGCRTRTYSPVGADLQSAAPNQYAPILRTTQIIKER